jgi:hypothetical protein
VNFHKIKVAKLSWDPCCHLAEETGSRYILIVTYLSLHGLGWGTNTGYLGFINLISFTLPLSYNSSPKHPVLNASGSLLMVFFLTFAKKRKKFNPTTKYFRVILKLAE